ncbi:Protein of unknown function D [Prunus dulcis]|uniref:Uncharacterized protein n=1 Tax=Prunus dulcis TaxID=3755 RepID=A0A4Y1RJ09_PRUDU|nr:Protein of unknown function D [Prunus dulcis]
MVMSSSRKIKALYKFMSSRKNEDIDPMLGLCLEQNAKELTAWKKNTVGRSFVLFLQSFYASYCCFFKLRPYK